MVNLPVDTPAVKSPPLALLKSLGFAESHLVACDAHSHAGDICGEPEDDVVAMANILIRDHYAFTAARCLEALGLDELASFVSHYEPTTEDDGACTLWVESST